MYLGKANWLSLASTILFEAHKDAPSNGIVLSLPTVFNDTIRYFKNYKDCVLVFVRDSNLKSVSETLRGYKSKGFYKDGQDKLIRNYGIGAQIIKTLNIKKMILVTRSKKKVIGLDGYGLKISKQEIIKWKKKFVL